MSASNGVLKIERKGKKKFAIGDAEPVEIDVSIVYDQWFVIDHDFADENGMIPPANLIARNTAMRNFVAELLKCDDVTMAEAQEFINILTVEVNKLRDFFSTKWPATPGSAENLEVRFSQ